MSLLRNVYVLALGLTFSQSFLVFAECNVPNRMPALFSLVVQLTNLHQVAARCQCAGSLPDSTIPTCAVYTVLLTVLDLMVERMLGNSLDGLIHSDLKGFFPKRFSFSFISPTKSWI